jgi:hypothetical protein
MTRFRTILAGFAFSISILSILVGVAGAILAPGNEESNQLMAGGAFIAILTILSQLLVAEKKY